MSSDAGAPVAAGSASSIALRNSCPYALLAKLPVCNAPWTSPFLSLHLYPSQGATSMTSLPELMTCSHGRQLSELINASCEGTYQPCRKNKTFSVVAEPLWIGGM